MFVPALIFMILTYVSELVFAFLELEKPRKIVKPFCLVALILFLITLKLDNIYVYGALFFGLIGDIFLIYKKHKMMILLGIFSFFIGHLFYIFTFVELLSYEIPKIAIVLIVALGLLSPLLPYKICYSKTKSFTVPGAIYMFTLVLELVLAILVALDKKSGYSNLLLIGNVLFFASDIILSISMFFKDFKRRDFYIMSTYLAAQTLMSLGLLFMLG
jgi:uncharacterized membrane protein YhhN